MNRSSLTRYAWLSIGAAILTISLKAVAYFLTGSAGLLSDALESMVNMVGSVMALVMLVVAARPPDEEHAYGHDKAEYFASGVEGSLIVVAAVSIAITNTPAHYTATTGTSWPGINYLNCGLHNKLGDGSYTDSGRTRAPVHCH